MLRDTLQHLKTFNYVQTNGSGETKLFVSSSNPWNSVCLNWIIDITKQYLFNLLSARHRFCLSDSYSHSYYHLPRQYTGLHSSAAKQQQMPLLTMLLLYRFWLTRNLHMLQTPSHQRWDARPTNCTPNDAHAFVFPYFRFSTRKKHSRHFRTLR